MAEEQQKKEVVGRRDEAAATLSLNEADTSDDSLYFPCPISISHLTSGSSCQAHWRSSGVPAATRAGTWYSGSTSRGQCSLMQVI